MSKLDAAISRLSEYAEDLEHDYEEQLFFGNTETALQYDTWMKDCNAAIRILEAAAKVDKTKALIVYDDVCDKLYGEGWADPEDQGVPIRILLESLPDEEEK